MLTLSQTVDKGSPQKVLISFLGCNQITSTYLFQLETLPGTFFTGSQAFHLFNLDNGLEAQSHYTPSKLQAGSSEAGWSG